MTRLIKQISRRPWQSIFAHIKILLLKKNHAALTLDISKRCIRLYIWTVEISFGLREFNSSRIYAFYEFLILVTARTWPLKVVELLFILREINILVRTLGIDSDWRWPPRRLTRYFNFGREASIIDCLKNIWLLRRIWYIILTRTWLHVVQIEPVYFFEAFRSRERKFLLFFIFIWA